ncbi:aldehyde dehydrogenase family protein [Actinotalea sp. K2]|uniref:aldehyde dehydrogenase family protein n=1 Tax=Actinotalea sp. K2 TaxID=2939438 RepID=UPI0020173473|nr:aldehyde dehydrogenase family protein [Actinotalea sp. K2]MCL3859794.1 aldehyde dehydrogenase family protein [Actinotalea sp. K2]
MTAAELDLDLRSVQEARDRALAAREAQRAFRFAEQGDVDRICAAMADVAFRESARWGEMAAEETGYGLAAHKRLKNEFASRDVWESIKDIPTCGVLRRDEVHQVVEIGWPVGVVAALTPSTNPTSTAIFKILIAVKARNAVVVAPHPTAVRCTSAAVAGMAAAGEAAGMPPGLVSSLNLVTLNGTHELMSHYATSMILATGGTPMVKAAHSVGKPALGVGPGNVPVYVDRSADVARAATDIVSSKAFDCSTICATEQTVVADRPIAAQLRREMADAGAHWIDRAAAERLGRLMFRPGGTMDPRYVGRTPRQIGELAGIDVPGSARVLVADLEGVGPAHPLSREKLTTVLGFIEEDGWRAGCERSIEILTFGGDGHSLVLHAQDEDVVLAFGIEKPAFRILVNTWGTFGAIGASTGLMPSMTLAPGGLGGSVVSDNITVHHLLNVKRLAYETRRPPAEAFSRPGHAGASDAGPGTATNGRAGTVDVDLVTEVVRRVLQEVRR